MQVWFLHVGASWSANHNTSSEVLHCAFSLFIKRGVIEGTSTHPTILLTAFSIVMMEQQFEENFTNSFTTPHLHSIRVKSDITWYLYDLLEYREICNQHSNTRMHNYVPQKTCTCSALAKHLCLHLHVGKHLGKSLHTLTFLHWLPIKLRINYIEV